MRTNKLMRLFTGGLVAVILLLGVWPATADAQIRVYRTPSRVVVVHRPFFPRVYTYPRTVVYDPIAYQRETGYSDGRSRGKSDARHDKAYSPESHKHFRDASSITYREAFLQGYADGFRDERNG